MADTLTGTQRSERMKLIRSRNTKPELAVRKLVFSLGYRYRLHRADLPGKPDLVFPARKKAIFVHGCFWHQHNCGRYLMPKSRVDFWAPKLTKNKARDKRNQRDLKAEGWKFLVVWECQLKDLNRLSKRLVRFLEA